MRRTLRKSAILRTTVQVGEKNGYESLLSQRPLLSSIYDPAGSIQAENTPAFVRRLQLVADPRLDADSTTRWYLTSNPNTFGWVFSGSIWMGNGSRLLTSRQWLIGTSFRSNVGMTSLRKRTCGRVE